MVKSIAATAPTQFVAVGTAASGPAGNTVPAGASRPVRAATGFTDKLAELERRRDSGATKSELVAATRRTAASGRVIAGPTHRVIHRRRAGDSAVDLLAQFFEGVLHGSLGLARHLRRSRRPCGLRPVVISPRHLRGHRRCRPLSLHGPSCSQ
jgi:hypothetical protein